MKFFWSTFANLEFQLASKVVCAFSLLMPSMSQAQSSGTMRVEAVEGKYMAVAFLVSCEERSDQEIFANLILEYKSLEYDARGITLSLSDINNTAKLDWLKVDNEDTVIDRIESSVELVPIDGNVDLDGRGLFYIELIEHGKLRLFIFQGQRGFLFNDPVVPPTKISLCATNPY